MEAFISLSPWTLKTKQDRFLLIAFKDRQRFFVPKAAPEAALVVSVLRSALDRDGTVLVRVAPEDPHRIVEARLEEHPDDEVADWRCPDRPEMTGDFWAAQAVVSRPDPDLIWWVGKPPGCSSFRVRFYTAADFRWIHPQHPKAKEMLALAHRSIDEDLQVMCFEHEGFGEREFLGGIKPYPQ